MSATHALFLRWKAQKAFPSDRQAALALGLDPSSVTLWKGGRNGSLPVIERMANDLGEDYVPIVMAVFLETARDEPERKAWRRLAKRLATGGALALMLALPLPGAKADTGTGPDNAPGLYIMRSGRKSRKTRKRTQIPNFDAPHQTQPAHAAGLGALAGLSTFPEHQRHEPTTLHCSRSSNERLRSQRLRLRGQRRSPLARPLARLAAGR